MVKWYHKTFGASGWQFDSVYPDMHDYNKKSTTVTVTEYEYDDDGRLVRTVETKTGGSTAPTGTVSPILWCDNCSS